VGREIRNHLDAAEIRERRCAVSLPLGWALTLQTKLPELPEEDLASFLQIEAERGFPFGLEALLISCARFRLADGTGYATQVAVLRDHVLRLEKVLRAARLIPLSFSWIARDAKSGLGSCSRSNRPGSRREWRRTPGDLRRRDCSCAHLDNAVESRERRSGFTRTRSFAS
jgi:hypothetical protein